MPGNQYYSDEKEKFGHITRKEEGDWTKETCKIAPDCPDDALHRRE